MFFYDGVQTIANGFWSQKDTTNENSGTVGARKTDNEHLSNLCAHGLLSGNCPQPECAAVMDNMDYSHQNNQLDLQPRHQSFEQQRTQHEWGEAYVNGMNGSYINGINLVDEPDQIQEPEQVQKQSQGGFMSYVPTFSGLSNYLKRAVDGPEPDKSEPLEQSGYPMQQQHYLQEQTQYSQSGYPVQHHVQQQHYLHEQTQYSRSGYPVQQPHTQMGHMGSPMQHENTTMPPPPRPHHTQPQEKK